LSLKGDWRIGDFRRERPVGYAGSIDDKEVSIADPRVNEFNNRLKIITQSKELFSSERLKTIVMCNSGAYNHLLED
jgi:hypothetical protein